MGKVLVNFKMDQEEYARVRTKASREEVNLSGLLRAYLRNWLAGRTSALGSFFRWLCGQMSQDLWYQLILRSQQDLDESRYDDQTRIALRYFISFEHERQDRKVRSVIPEGTK